MAFIGTIVTWLIRLIPLFIVAPIAIGLGGITVGAGFGVAQALPGLISSIAFLIQILPFLIFAPLMITLISFIISSIRGAIERIRGKEEKE
jgi:hypothetical protein